MRYGRSVYIHTALRYGTVRIPFLPEPFESCFVSGTSYAVTKSMTPSGKTMGPTECNFLCSNEIGGVGQPVRGRPKC